MASQEDEHRGTRLPARQAKEPSEGEIQRSLARYELLKWTLPAVWIAALWIPLQAAIPIAKALAGKHTSLVVTFSISILITLSVTGGLIASMRRDRERRRELERLRRRADRLEAELRELKAGGSE